MEDLKLYNLLLVGDAEDKEYFQKYFQDIYLIKNNTRAFNFYTMYKPLIIFFYCDEKVFDTISIIEKIREHDRDTIIVIILKRKNIDNLVEALPLHLSGYFEKPYQRDRVEKVLKQVSHDLDLQHEHRVKLRGGYVFNRKQHILYDNKKQEVKITKNELKLMRLMSNNREQYVSLEQIEYTIWEEASAIEDCHARLKALLYGLRRKLPENAIINSYGLGYKLVSV